MLDRFSTAVRISHRLPCVLNYSHAQELDLFAAKSLLRLGHLWFWVCFLKGALIFTEKRLDAREFGFYGFAQFRMSCEIIKDCRHRFRIDQESLMTYIRQCIGFHAVRMIRKIGGFRADSNS